MVKRKLKFWSIPVTEYMNARVEEAVLSNLHVSKSDFVRDAVREKLARLGMLQNRQIQQEREKQ